MIKTKPKPKQKTSREIKTFDDKMHGFEPVIAEITSPNSAAFARALNWYNYTYSGSDGKKWLFDYLKEENFDSEIIRKAKKLSDNCIPTTACWIARMKLNGTIILDSNRQFIVDSLNHAIDRFYVDETEKVDKPVVNIQARVLEKNNSLYTDLEELFDQDQYDVYNFLIKNQATPAAASFIRAKILPQLEEVMLDDPDVKESYGKKLKFWQQIYQKMIDDCDQYIGNKKAVKVKKPKTIKIKPVTKVVERLNFQKEFGPLRLVSINATEIVGATQLWVFNTKTRVLGVYNTSDGATLNVKGSTVINWDEKKSTAKRLRKPEDILPGLLKAGKVTLRTFLDDIKTTVQPVTGRINKDTILLRVQR